MADPGSRLMSELRENGAAATYSLNEKMFYAIID